MYCCAMFATSGSAVLQSVSNAIIESNTFDIVNAGDQLSLRMSRHIAPCELMLQWYIRVRKIIFGGLNGYSEGNVISRKKIPPW